MAELVIYLSGSSGANGTYRRNVTFEYFRDFAATQVVEAGIDIDMDAEQFMGRINRS